MARVSVAYTLWLVGFWMGLHHLYLRRPRAAFLHAATLNMGGIGWWRDLLAIPSLVAEANRDSEFITKKAVEQRFHAKPPVSWLVVWIQLILAQVFGLIASALIPRDSPEVLYELLFAIGASWSIWFAGVALDEQVQSSFKRVFAVVLGVMLPAYYLIGEGDAMDSDYKSAKGVVVLLGCIVFWYNRQWSFVIIDSDAQAIFAQGLSTPGKDTQESKSASSTGAMPTRPSWWRTLLVYYALLGAFIAAVITGVSFHGEITVNVDGETRTHSFPEAAENVLRSEELFKHFYDLFTDILNSNGDREDEQFEHKWRNFQTKIDISGRKRYFKVLGLQNAKDPSQAEIKSAYKKLALKWHPDKYDGEDAAHAQKMFYDVQEAYERLQKLPSSTSSESFHSGKYYQHRDDEL